MLDTVAIPLHWSNSHEMKRGWGDRDANSQWGKCESLGPRRGLKICEISEYEYVKSVTEAW